MSDTREKTPQELCQMIKDLLSERDALLKAELDRLSTGKTQFCAQCERYARENEALKEATNKILGILNEPLRPDTIREMLSAWKRMSEK